MSSLYFNQTFTITIDCLMSREQYFSYIQDEKTSVIYNNLYRIEGGMGQLEQRFMTATGRSIKNWVETKHLVFCSGYNTLTLIWNQQKRSLTYRERGTLQTHYTPWSGFLYIITHWQVYIPISIFTVWGSSCHFCGFVPREPSLVLSSQLRKESLNSDDAK